MKVVGVFVNANQVEELQAGTVIFNEGDEGHHMFGIIEGEVELVGSSGVKLQLGPDEIFGEMALIDHSTRSATCTALTDVKLAILDQRRFLFLVQETPMFALQVMHTLTHRLRASH